MCFFASTMLYAQNAEKSYFENNPQLGGDAVIVSADLRVPGR